MRYGTYQVVALLAVFLAPLGARGDWVVPAERVESRVTVREEPTSGAKSVGQLRVGERAELLASIPYWYEIALPNGTRGFVSKSWATVIAAADAGDEAAGEEGAATEFAIHVVDVGTGDGLLIDVGDQEILIDGGWDASPFNDYLTKHELIDWPIELVVVTHADYDHWNGLRKVLGLSRETLPAIVREFWEPGFDRACKPSPTYDAFLRDMRRIPGITIRRPLEEQRPPSIISGEVAVLKPLSHPNVRVAVLHTESDPPLITNCSYRINDASIVLLLEIDTYRFLLTGDANGKEYTEDTPGHVESKLLAFEAQHPGTLKVDVLKVPHHGSETASTTAFIKAVQPTFAVVSASTKHHLPKHTVIDRYEEANAIVLRTDLDVRSGIDHIICYPTADGTVDCNYRSVLFPDD